MFRFGAFAPPKAEKLTLGNSDKSGSIGCDIEFLFLWSSVRLPLTRLE